MGFEWGLMIGSANRGFGLRPRRPLERPKLRLRKRSFLLIDIFTTLLRKPIVGEHYYSVRSCMLRAMNDSQGRLCCSILPWIMFNIASSAFRLARGIKIYWLQSDQVYQKEERTFRPSFSHYDCRSTLLFMDKGVLMIWRRKQTWFPHLLCFCRHDSLALICIHLSSMHHMWSERHNGCFYLVCIVLKC